MPLAVADPCTRAECTFNSLFEMRNNRNDPASPRHAKSFNSLFEMRIRYRVWVYSNDSRELSILYLRCGVEVRLYRLADLLLSILYLRCGAAVGAATGRDPVAFNSLFEMRRTGGTCRLSTASGFQFSI